MRQRRKGSQDEGSQIEGSQEETVPASYVYGTTGKYQFLPERPRYLTLSDGQVLDRLNQPQPVYHIRSMNMCNEARFNYHPTKALKK